MNDSPLALVGARLQRPVIPPGTWPRPALQARLDAIPQFRLTRLMAPAGFGKSLALSDWAGRSPARAGRIGWLRLEAGECAPRLLCAYLDAALTPNLTGLRRPGGRVLVPARDPDGGPRQWLEPVLERLWAANETAPEVPQVLVIDDVHALEGESDSVDLLLRLLREGPDSFHLVLSGRRQAFAVPGELVASRRVLDLASDDLRIAPGDEAAFARSVLDEDCPAETVDWCASLSGGWPLPALMLWRQLRPPHDLVRARARWPAMLADLEAFLGNEVFRTLPLRLIEFLQLIAVCDRLDIGLAEALAGGEDAAELLTQLVRHGLLQDDGARPGSYLLEPLVATCLRERLQRERPGHMLILHRRAAGWHAAQGAWPDAIDHALAGGDASLAASWVEAQGEAELGRGAFRRLLGWIARLPEECRFGRPRIQLLQAWSLTLLHRRQEAADVLARLGRQRRESEREALAVESVMSAIADDSQLALSLGEQVLRMSPPPGSFADLAGHTAVIFGLTAASEFDAVERMRLEQRDSLVALDTLAGLYRQNLFGFSAFQAGRLDPAGLVFEEVMAHARAAGAPARAPAAVAAAYLAAIHYERDDPERARALLEGRRDVVAEGASLGALLQCLQIEARLASLDGQHEAALALLEHGVEVGLRRSHLRLQAGCLGESVRLLLARGQTLEADRTLRRLLSLGVREPRERGVVASKTWDEVRLAEARVLLATNAPRRAVPALRALWQDLANGRRGYLAARAAVVLVRALEAAGDPEGALEPLWQALRFGQDNGLVRTFTDEGPGLAGPISRLLLEGDLQDDIDPEYLRRLRVALDPTYARQQAARPAAAAGSTSAAGPRLSTREIEILQYMARGLSNKEIARALGLSPETVKWYLKHIYDKLQVSGRVQAIQVGLGVGVPQAGEPDTDA